MDNKKQKVLLELSKLNARRSLNGYRYIIEAICIYIDSPVCNITKDIYPVVAELFDTTAARVERAIRHLISTLDPKLQYNNKEFIARIAEKIWLQEDFNNNENF